MEPFWQNQFVHNCCFFFIIRRDSFALEAAGKQELRAFASINNTSVGQNDPGFQIEYHIARRFVSHKCSLISVNTLIQDGQQCMGLGVNQRDRLVYCAGQLGSELKHEDQVMSSVGCLQVS